MVVPAAQAASEIEVTLQRRMAEFVAVSLAHANWMFVVAASRADLNSQISQIRSILAWSFASLGAGLFLLAAVQNWYGLLPLRRVRRDIARVRTLLAEAGAKA